MPCLGQQRNHLILQQVGAQGDEGAGPVIDHHHRRGLIAVTLGHDPLDQLVEGTGYAARKL
ncbi:hypothetical protein [Magnetospirillum molischianum]|uniref:hypothetical protein n=1 Tax=Magnetospirillum molischianum TaxID=1083 RepID=UPI00058BB02E|nr:hypothetical protein [Magnetospirillum molischianum]